MPKMVDQLTAKEQEIEKSIRAEFSEEQLCAYFLTKTVRSLYQFNDDFISGWYQETFDHEPADISLARRELVKAYTNMLMFENKYRFHLDYWLRQYQARLIEEIRAFFSDEAGK